MLLAWLRRLHPGNFRGRLTLWFGLLSLTTLLIVGLYVGRIASLELAEFGGRTLHISARSAADLLASNLSERDREIRLLRESLVFANGDLHNPEIGRMLTVRQQTHDEYAWIGVVDLHGTVLQAPKDLLVGNKIGHWPWYQAALKGPYTGDVHEAQLLAEQFPQRAAKEPMRFIDFAAPILDAQGRVRGVLGAQAHWDWVIDMAEAATTQNATQRQLEMLIADVNGNILYPFHHTGSLQLPKPVQPDKPYEILRWNDDRDYLTSIAEVQAKTSTPLGWRIVLRQPLDDAVRPLRTLHRELEIFGLVVAFVFAFIAYRLATRVSQPIEQLARAVRDVERRDRLPVYPDEHKQINEIRQLSASIQSMTGALLRHEKELKTLNASLEQQVHERTEALSIANQELERLATVDGLTGVHNRRHFDARIKEAFQLLGRSERGFGLLLLDIDHFKSINDRHGHQAGDEVLRRLGQLLTQSTRVTDFVARYGGEEFVVLLPECTDPNEGSAVAEKIRAAVAATDFPEVGQVTASVGLSLARKDDASAEAVVTRADQALYEAKAQGRNRVVAR
ncbi:diguanylate cyclase [Hylemonella gracilis]|jgi:diguanylate cyclase (GGDEF)-like protein|uniref:diguanylate cyclase n=1 Tax=Hylemonella gracilis TaxID=80880 RepID=A0A4P6UL19_9BURK|nr:sensor domain-containing diguanylate cyclase [Hylemonella gracilis]QBK05204.1 diguanylate cyclase [Hylemonella gracilis]